MERAVREIMRRHFVTVSVREGLDEALRIMRMARLRHLLVEQDGELVGILSYRDLLDRALARLEEAEATPRDASGTPVSISEAMMASPYVLTPDAPLSEAASRLTNLHIGCLPVVEREDGSARLVGLVTESDLLRAAFPTA